MAAGAATTLAHSPRRAVEARIPAQEIARRRQEPAVAREIAVRRMNRVATARPGRIAGRAPGVDGRKIVPPPPVGHSARLENRLPRKRAEGLPARQLDDDGGADMGGVAAKILRARRKIEIALPIHHAHRLRVFGR